MNIQQNNTQYCVNQKTMITNTTLDYNSGNGGFARSPTVLRALKRALQDMPGSDRWYETMPKECVIVWTMETTDLEEVIATEEMKAKEEKKKRKKRERKQKKEQKGKERKGMRNYADALRPWQSPMYWVLRQRGRILHRGTRILRRTIRRRAMHLLPPEPHRGNA